MAIPIKNVPIIGFILMDDIITQLPRDLVLDLAEIRKWALQKNMITDPEFQFFSGERAGYLANMFTKEDELQIAVILHSVHNEPLYLEYPYLPIKTLVARGEEIEINYWRMIPSAWDTNGKVLAYGETRIGFLLPGCSEEFCTQTSAKYLVQKFQTLMLELSKEFAIEVYADGSKEITEEGLYKAKFSKNGRFFDVDLIRV